MVPRPVRRPIDEDAIRDWVVAAARAADGKQGRDTVVLEVGPVLAITDWFVITSGASPRQVKTLAEEIEEKVGAAGGPKPLQIEGLDALQWVLMDYGDFVVHVFHDETRAYYELERLYRDVYVLDWRAESADVRLWS